MVEITLKAFSLLEKIVAWGVIAFIFYHLSPFLMKLAGEETSANFQMELFFGKKLTHWTVCYLVGGAGLAYGWRQHVLRRKSIRLLEGQSRKFEESVDPDRTSSGLDKKGDTNPKDK